MLSVLVRRGLAFPPCCDSPTPFWSGATVASHVSFLSGNFHLRRSGRPFLSFLGPCLVSFHVHPTPRPWAPVTLESWSTLLDIYPAGSEVYQSSSPVPKRHVSLIMHVGKLFSNSTLFTLAAFYYYQQTRRYFWDIPVLSASRVLCWVGNSNAVSTGCLVLSRASFAAR